MSRKGFYLGLCVIGVAVPYWWFVPWVMQHGLDLRLFWGAATANPIGAMFVADVLMSAVALVAFMRAEGGRVKIRGRWWPIAGLCLVGVSLALPLYLYLRERALEEAAK